MNAEQLAEMKRLHEAVDWFASAMKTRLTQKLEAGYKGWDKDRPTSFRLAADIEDDADWILRDHGGHWEKESVDIANRAMMIWWREKQNQGKRV